MNPYKLNKRGFAVFILGAGASKDSGIPTYRGEGGVLNEPEKVLSVNSDPNLRDETLSNLKRACDGIVPGPTYESIKKLSSRYDGCAILTQNVDGLVRGLGIPYVEMHGNKDEKVVLYGENIIFPPIAHIWTKQPFTDVFVVGTSMTLPYLRKIISSMKKKGGRIVHINPDENYNTPDLVRKIEWDGSVRIKKVEKVKKNEVWICKDSKTGLEEILGSI